MKSVRYNTRKRTLESKVKTISSKNSDVDDVLETKKESFTSDLSCNLHTFSEDNRIFIRRNLLSWYDANQRQLPWRDLAKSNLDINNKGYGVWVSEVMLQQTQVATVIKYYNNWMKKWPTVQVLAEATLEEVNQVWSGLGYYSRAKSLHEGARHICQELKGQMPTDPSKLVKEIKGIGRYTAAAVASIAFGQVVGLVDGNVSRVFTRLRAIGADITKPSTLQFLWKLADVLVDREKPGDFNQALMELGATICTPRNPNCQACPLKTCCLAFKMVNSSNSSSKSEEIPDIESVSCNFCLPKSIDIKSQGVCSYPQKAAKKAPRKEESLVMVLEDTSKVPARLLMVRRPAKGLLANLWEFPNTLVPQPATTTTTTSEMLEKLLNSTLKSRFQLSMSNVKEKVFVGEVVHIFSHIHSTYKVYKVRTAAEAITVGESYPEHQWLTPEEIPSVAVPTAMIKVLKCIQADQMNSKTSGSPRKRLKINKNELDKNQRTMLGFLVKK